MRRPLQLCLSLLAVTVLLAAATTTTSASANASKPTFMKVKPAHNAAKPRRTANLFYHGGLIEGAAKVYIVFWGPDWVNGFSTGGFSSAQAQTYVKDFFGGVGGSSWANSTTQYCQGVATGTTLCGSRGTHPANPSNELAGTWVDGSAVPASPTQNQIQAEASTLAAKFGGVDPNADYMVFTPSGHSMTGFATNWCAWHSSSGNLSYSYIPYQPDAGTSCGMNFVNPNDNSYGNGYFDGFSIVAGHEYAETITDPYPNSGWLDGRGAENGDKCAWISAGQGAASNINLGGGHSYAVQSLWSNAFNSGGGGCVLAYP
ncbi:MAG TPA: hypothetical protein VJR46_08175 [Candidatus Dormibacteraeota bacterium]|nr:hypothetical protein [Candidatus Dormibacteraeota bacterium]